MRRRKAPSAQAAIGGNELESTKSLLAETKRELDSIKSDFDLMKDTQGSVTQKYENEKALKERAQQMEENERRERKSPRYCSRTYSE